MRNVANECIVISAKTYRCSRFDLAIPRSLWTEREQWNSLHVFLFAVCGQGLRGIRMRNLKAITWLTGADIPLWLWGQTWSQSHQSVSGAEMSYIVDVARRRSFSILYIPGKLLFAVDLSLLTSYTASGFSTSGDCVLLHLILQLVKGLLILPDQYVCISCHDAPSQPVCISELAPARHAHEVACWWSLTLLLSTSRDVEDQIDQLMKHAKCINCFRDDRSQIIVWVGMLTL